MAKFRKTSTTKDEIISRARQVLEKHPQVVFAYLFGSQAIGTSSPMSDIDIAVYLEGGDSGDIKLAILGDMMESLKTDEIDLVILNTAPLPLTARILMNREILIDSKPNIRHAFESLMLREYFDFSIKEAAILKRRYSIG